MIIGTLKKNKNIYNWNLLVNSTFIASQLWYSLRVKQENNVDNKHEKKKNITEWTENNHQLFVLQSISTSNEVLNSGNLVSKNRNML